MTKRQAWDPARAEKKKRKEKTAKYDVLTENAKQKKRVTYVPLFSKLCHTISDIDSNKGIYPPRYEEIDTVYEPKKETQAQKRQRQDIGGAPKAQEKRNKKTSPAPKK